MGGAYDIPTDASDGSPHADSADYPGGDATTEEEPEVERAECGQNYYNYIYISVLHNDS
jgi:hypothetical protein